MAFWRRKNGRVIVEYWDVMAGKKAPLPRPEIRFLDDWSDSEIENWVDRWEQDQGPKVARVKKNHLLDEDEAKALFDKFLDAYAVLKKISSTTIEDEQNRFYNHIVPIMVGDFERKDVRSWGTALPSLTTELLAKGRLGPAQVNKCLGLLKRFSRHLKVTGVLSQAWDVEYAKVPKATTALIAPKTPAQVLAFIRRQTDVRVKLMGYLAFFASLRPEEIFSLEKEDFLTGALAVEKSPTYARFQKIVLEHKITPWPKASRVRKYSFEIYKAASSERFKKAMETHVLLGSKLTIHVKRSMARDGEINNHTKKENLQKHNAVMRREAEIESTGEYITIWYPAAARELAQILKSLPAGPLFKVKRKRLFEIWMNASERILKATLRDMRRASGFFLGRETDIPPTLLQDHMRHEDFKTTLLYMRRPNVADPENNAPDFDDVD